MRAFAIQHVGWCEYRDYVLMYELFVAFGHLSINTKVNLQKEKEKEKKEICICQEFHSLRIENELS